EGDLATRGCSETPDLIRPVLEGRVVRDSAFQRDRVVLRAAGRVTGRAGIPSLAMLHHFRRSLETAHTADTGDISTVPLHFELEVLVRIETMRIHGELRHRRLLGIPRRYRVGKAKARKGDLPALPIEAGAETAAHPNGNPRLRRATQDPGCRRI